MHGISGARHAGMNSGQGVIMQLVHPGGSIGGSGCGGYNSIVPRIHGQPYTVHGQFGQFTDEIEHCPVAC